MIKTDEAPQGDDIEDSDSIIELPDGSFALAPVTPAPIDWADFPFDEGYEADQKDTHSSVIDELGFDPAELWPGE